MIRSGLILMIKDLALKGKSVSQIASEVGVSENTARKYIAEPMKPHGLLGRKKPSKLDSYKPMLQEMMNQGIFNCVVLLDRIRNMGYDGSMTILKDYVHPFRPGKSTPAVRRYETLPGKQAQMNWGICQFEDEQGQLHHVPSFVMVLSHSRASYVEFTARCDLRSLERCMIHAFEYFGGIPEEVLTDNMKTVVDHREAGKVIWNPQFANFAAELGFVPKVCKVRKPQTKGKVERLVRYVKENFFPGRIFTNLEDLNRQALQWCHQVNAKVHATTGKIPAGEMASEPLKPLPEQAVLDRYRWETRHATRDGLVSYDGIRYGIPWQYSGKEVQVRLHNGKVEIYYNETLLAAHEATHGAGRTIHLTGQYQGLIEKHGIAIPSCIAHMQSASVEQRDLSFYDQMIGGVHRG